MGTEKRRKRWGFCKVLTREEVDTKKIFKPEVGEWIDFLEQPP
jgi:hypothetical protein